MYPRKTTLLPAGLAVLATAVIAGSAMLVFGGTRTGPPASPAGSAAVGPSAAAVEAATATAPASPSPVPPAISRSVSAGDMTAPRSGHSATLLADGKVLIAGGDGGDEFRSSAELYDPATGAFSPTGSMAVPRVHQSATLLQDGRVLIFGGNTNLDFSDGKVRGRYQRLEASAEIYDPATGRFSATGSVPPRPDAATYVGCPAGGCPGMVAFFARDGHTATLLEDGRVLLAGGEIEGWGSAAAELYDPATGTFSLTGPMLEGRRGHQAFLLHDGRVLIVGGTDGTGTRNLSSVEIYDPATGKFTASKPLLSAFGAAGAAMLADGRVLVVDGHDPAYDYLAPSAIPPASAELYDPAGGSFEPTGSMFGSEGGVAVLLRDGGVLVVGWMTPAELYDPAGETFRQLEPPLEPRTEFTVTVLLDGRVLVAGGFDNATRDLRSAELYVP